MRSMRSIMRLFQAHSPGRTETTHARELNPVHVWLLSNTWGFSLILLSNISGNVFTLLPFSCTQTTDSSVLMPSPCWQMWCVHVLQLCTNELPHLFQQPVSSQKHFVNCYDIFSTLGNNHFKVPQGIPSTFLELASETIATLCVGKKVILFFVFFPPVCSIKCVVVHFMSIFKHLLW